MKRRNAIAHRLLRFWKILGPGLVTGSSDDDPSGIATYSQAGALCGLSTLWTALVTIPLMASIQEMCATSNTFGFLTLALMTFTAVVLVYMQLTEK
jgi:Mn2+/Fe2+ NRAMP family transporter